MVPSTSATKKEFAPFCSAHAQSSAQFSSPAPSAGHRLLRVPYCVRESEIAHFYVSEKEETVATTERNIFRRPNLTTELFRGATFTCGPLPAAHPPLSSVDSSW
ncbi:hypothetical protein SRHO_G00272420 [Serrasalmus rhombeus]